MATAKSNPAENTTEREIVITREFNAPRELVWEAMTNPKHVVNWWGPRGFSTTIEKMDFRVGGEWKHMMRGPDGANYPNHSIFQEIVNAERVVFAHGGKREGGPGVSFVSTWSFEKLAADKTRVTIRMVFPTAAERDFVVKEFGAIEGGKQTLERLGEFLAGTMAKPFIITREFNAPRELVWKAWSEPERMKEWLVPKGVTPRFDKMDFRPGGIYHYCQVTPDGRELWGKAVYREIIAPEKIVWIHSFSDKDGGFTRHPMSPKWPLEMLTEVTFSERAGKTTVILKWLPLDATDEERQTFDGARGDMTQGWTGTFGRLDDYLANAG